MEPNPRATLRTLLERSELGLSLLAGDPDTEFGSVIVLAREADRPWLRPVDLRIHEGPFTLPRPPADHVLEPAPAVVVHSLSSRRRSVPDALVERCRAAGVSLVVSPPTVDPEAIEEAALQLLVGSGRDALTGLAALQRRLLTTLDGPKPERAVLEAVSRLSGMGMAVLSPWGEVVARAGDTTGRLGGADPTALPEGRMRFRGRDALVARVTVKGRLRYVLVAFEEGAGSLTWLELTRSLLVASALQRSAEAQQDRSRKGALLAEWLAGPQAAPMLLPRLVDAGIETESEYVVAVAEAGPRARGGRMAAVRGQALLEKLREAADDYFRTRGYGYLSETRAEHVVWVLSGGAPRAQGEPLFLALRAAAGADVPVRLGLSLPREDLTGVADAYHQAVLAAQSLAGPEGHAWFDLVDPVYWVLKQQPPANLATMRDRLVGPVKDADDGKLWRTLTAYLRSPDDLTALAEELHVHVNTLRYRLKRIATLLGVDLARPETLAKLYLAQQIDAMLDREGGV
ncbi:MAG TPA: helix-turn-helix domain-containing protein [Trueperaceae bacterium]|nr:helix-turn-helix domain-containing protein [Trueperaceae bacterium]